ncbi:MAG: mechanosensitive ion channel domain-containing protein [Francisellaceae bacterium]
MEKPFIAELYQHIFNTTILLVLFLLFFIAFRIFSHYRYDDVKRRKIIRLRFRYVLIIIFLILLIRVWVDGLTNIFTMLSLVAAGLVVTNKESIMNLIGYMVIQWRNVFAEGDYIEIASKSGYVIKTGPFYFSLSEIDPKKNIKLGKVIRVPNGLIINSIIINYSQKKTPFDIVIDFKIKLDKTYTEFVARLDHEIRQLVESHASSIASKSLKQLIANSTKVRCRLDKENASLLAVTIKCKAQFHLHQELEDDINKLILQLVDIPTDANAASSASSSQIDPKASLTSHPD